MERIKSLLWTILLALKAKIWKYFSGRLAIVQLVAGLGAFALRSAAVFMTLGYESWIIVLAGILGSFTGYVSAYVLGYWITFRNEYRTSGRSMLFDIFRLQLVEQLPNIWTVAGSGLTQGALIEGTDLPPVLAVNVGSWFGPQKILNVAAMLTSNSLKRAWVDGSWKPLTVLRSWVHRLLSPWRKVRRLLGLSGAQKPGKSTSMTHSAGVQTDDPAYDKDS